MKRQGKGGRRFTAVNLLALGRGQFSGAELEQRGLLGGDVVLGCSGSDSFATIAVRTVHAFKPFPFGLTEVSPCSATTLAGRRVGLDFIQKSPVLGAEFVESAKDSEGSLTAECEHVGADLFAGPTCEHVAVDDVLAQLSEVISGATILHFYYREVLADALGPLFSKTTSINPGSVNESMQVKVPSLTFIRNFQAIETARPVFSETTAT